MNRIKKESTDCLPTGTTVMLCTAGRISFLSRKVQLPLNKPVFNFPLKCLVDDYEV